MDLVKHSIEKATLSFYADDPLADIADWIWRFSLFSTGPRFSAHFDGLMLEFRSVVNKTQFIDFMGVYGQSLAKRRGAEYFNIFTQFYENYSQFAPAMAYVKMDMEKEGASYAPTENDFLKIRMFYGTAFECFGTLIELLAFVNNIVLGRRFDEFARLKIGEYRSLDKSKKRDAFASQSHFMAICVEYDNQLRNASHHGEIRLSDDGRR